ncbi:hypothetical protein CPB84DRAFT_1849393 [Gymnopilus junonius]|uniref:DUF6534 domain-containing protein n=1 Tax=Gymnopilus junonius TaxID=109634 RepID=A0A9P5NKQ0_GYMJU|nr:hypothetical protein CPB84DRAFT_1849393 [Gymnopilus junonius]
MTELDGTLGAAFLGCLAAAILYGVTSVQTFLYFQGHSSQDGLFFKIAIFGLWAVDTIHIAFTAHGMYYYLVTSFGMFEVLLAPTWSLLAGVYLTNISDIIVRCFFAMRVYLLCGRSRPILRVFLPMVIIVLALIVFINGNAFASKGFVLKTFAKLNDVSFFLYTSFAAAVVADTLVALSLCTLLFNSRTGIKRTDSVVTVIMAFIINTGLLTSVCAMGCLVTYAIWPTKFIFIGLYFALSKLYVNSLLASLNARASLRIRDQADPTNFEAAATPIVFPTRMTNTSASTAMGDNVKEMDTFQNSGSSRSSS